MTSVTRDTAFPAALTLRLLGAADAPALRRLAERDSRTVPRGELLGAELDGRLLAALPLADPSGAPLADPFESTAAIVALLGARAEALLAERSGLLERGHRQPRRGKLLPVQLGRLLRA